VIRAYVEHRLDQRPGVRKLYYIGPMFRRERPRKGRYRQFYQIGAEAIGSESPAVDAEVIEMVVEVLRPQYIERLRRELKSVAPRMCQPAAAPDLPAAGRIIDALVAERAGPGIPGTALYGQVDCFRVGRSERSLLARDHWQTLGEYPRESTARRRSHAPPRVGCTSM
jgi:hypothetical protein